MTFELGADMRIMVDDPEKGNQYEASYGACRCCGSNFVLHFTHLMLMLCAILIHTMAHQAVCN